MRITEKHSRTSGPLMAVGTWSTPTLLDCLYQSYTEISFYYTLAAKVVDGKSDDMNMCGEGKPIEADDCAGGNINIFYSTVLK